MIRLLAIAALASSISAGALHAQIKEQQPKEFPPSSYKGKQYVDSNGCVFIRAGIDGNVSWIPRVTRARKTVCGFQPSLAGQVAVAKPAPAVKAPVQITLNETSKPAPRAAKPTARRVQKPRKAPVVVRQTAPKPTPKVAPKPVVVATAPQVRTTVRQTQTACPGASALSQQYLRGNGKSAVRCGPQAAPIVGARVVGTGGQYHTATAAPQVSQNTRIVPKHVAHNRINTRNVTVPKGYKKVWHDDRLNPYRAEQTLGGRQQMLLVWTQTVPRRLIDTKTGRDVTASVPLVYPYIDVITQRQELGKVTIVQRDGQTAKRVVRNAGVRKPVYSSRSAPTAVAPKAAAPKASTVRATTGKRYLQVGTFGNAASAQQAAQKIARMGMPARIGKHRKGGKTYMTVQAGPFNGSGAIEKAMKRLRGAGYSDGFARN